MEALGLIQCVYYISVASWLFGGRCSGKELLPILLFFFLLMLGASTQSKLIERGV